MSLDPQLLGALLVQMGCPEAKAPEMALQLDKRAQQLAIERGQTYDESLRHLLKLMSQGWAAQGKQLPNFE